MTLSIPLFDRLSRLSEAQRAKQRLIIARSEHEVILRQIYSEIEQAVADVRGLQDESCSAHKKTEAMLEAHKVNTRKYDEGLINAIELATSANRLLVARLKKLTIHNVVKSEFNDYIRINGQVQPISTIQLSAVDRVKNGLAATFERQEKTYHLTVRKVYPEVRDKQFKTDFVFRDERPDNIRAGQTYYINLQLGQPVEALLIPRGGFYQNTGGQWIFVVSSDGKKALRRNIRIGRQNPLHYEVLSGLEAGEQVIVSGYENFGTAEELILK
jgi:multidrug efflux pump subunit AcrA (membrane-fusion protein)